MFHFRLLFIEIIFTDNVIIFLQFIQRPLESSPAKILHLKLLFAPESCRSTPSREESES